MDNNLIMKSPGRKVWYAIRTYNHKENEISKYLTDRGLINFIPMLYTERTKEGCKPKKILVPAVHNLLFLSKTCTEKEIRSILAECSTPMSILKNTDTGAYYEIPDSQMVEFRAMCDPNYHGTLYVTKDFADARPGKNIRVIHGPFKGLTGKLVQYKSSYFVVRTFAGIGVMLHIPKWYCEVLK